MEFWFLYAKVKRLHVPEVALMPMGGWNFTLDVLTPFILPAYFTPYATLILPRIFDPGKFYTWT